MEGDGEQWGKGVLLFGCSVCRGRCSGALPGSGTAGDRNGGTGNGSAMEMCMGMFGRDDFGSSQGQPDLVFGCFRVWLEVFGVLDAWGGLVVFSGV